MESIPFLIALFLFVNPVLEWVFRKREVAIEKLQFWIMVTSGTAWLIALLYFLLDPQESITPPARPGIELLPEFVFSFDRITNALILAAAGLVFITVLTRQESPRENAWLAGMGGACVFGLGSFSAFTLGLTWAILEAFHFYFSYQDRLISTNPRKFIPVAMLRLTAPGVLITLSLTQTEAGLSTFDEILNPTAGLILIGAGLVGFLGWFLSYKPQHMDHQPNPAGAAENWIPAFMNLMLMIRGGQAIEVPSPGIFPLILSLLLLLFSIGGLLLDRSSGMWFLGCGLLAAVSASISDPESAMVWGLVMSLPALRIWGLSDQPRKSLILLTLALLGIIPLPYLPAWVGVHAFQEGLPGILLGLSLGILMGTLLLRVLKNWNNTSPNAEEETQPLTAIIGAAALLVSQIVISFKLGLIIASQGLLAKPLQVWISILGVIPVLTLGNHLPLKKRGAFFEAGSRIESGLSWGLRAGVGLVDRSVEIISRVFEGQAGLIWALLIALLIITLVSLRGG